MNDTAPVKRWVIDTTVLISRALRPRSVPANAVRRAMTLGSLIFTTETFNELASVMRRSKFDAYVAQEPRNALLKFIEETSEWVVSSRPIRECRDPKDDKFLEAAVHGGADALITGDDDLLVMHPFHGVPILTPQAFILETTRQS